MNAENEHNAGTPSRSRPEAHGSVNPLTKQEQAQLDAVIVLLRRGEIAISRRILCQPTEDKTLVADLRAYIEAHSPNS